MRALAIVSLALVLLLTTLSAYLRLAHSGIGCADWPACYGRIGQAVEQSVPQSTEDAYARLVDESGRALAWATPLHRLVASVLGLLVVFLFFLALRHKRHRLLSAVLLGLTVYLAVIGIRSGGLHDPAIVMGNLSGGFAMVGLLGWLVFSMEESGTRAPTVAVMTTVAVVALVLQVLLGGLTSANFAATACQTLPDCHGGWWPGPALGEAMDLSRQHAVTASGQAIGGEERIAIHRAHRLAAIAALLLVAFAAVAALLSERRFRALAAVILVLVLTEIAVGVASVMGGIPMILALSHNVLAAMLLLALFKLLALSTRGGERSARQPG